MLILFDFDIDKTKPKLRSIVLDELEKALKKAAREVKFELLIARQQIWISKRSQGLKPSIRGLRKLRGNRGVRPHMPPTVRHFAGSKRRKS